MNTTGAPNRPRGTAIPVAVILCGIATVTLTAAWNEAGQKPDSIPRPPTNSPAGMNAYSCGVPATAEGGPDKPAQAVFPAGRYPVTLPNVSHLGARNDLPTPYAEVGLDREHYRGARRHDLGT
jgi:hypothetical protein